MYFLILTKFLLQHFIIYYFIVISSSFIITNLFNLGTQNGYQKYKFTSMESAVTNAIQLSHMFDSTLKHKYYIKGLPYI